MSRNSNAENALIACGITVFVLALIMAVMLLITTDIRQGKERRQRVHNEQIQRCTERDGVITLDANGWFKSCQYRP